MLRDDQPNRVEVDHRDVGAQFAGTLSNTLADRAETHHHDLAAVQRQIGDRVERWPRLSADVMPIVNEILQRDPVPVQDWEWDVDADQTVQPGRSGLKGSVGPISRHRRRHDQLTAHVAECIGWFARQPRQGVGGLNVRHAGVAPDFYTYRGKMLGCAVVGAVRVAWRHTDSGAGFDERADDSDGAGRDVLMTGHGASRKV